MILTTDIRIKIIIIPLILLISVLAGADDIHKYMYDKTKNVTGITGYSEFRLDNYDLSMEVPSNWISKRRGLKYDIYSGGTEVSFIGPAESKSQCGYSALTLRVVPKAENVLNYYIDKAIRSRSVGKAKILYKKDIKIGDTKGKEVTFSYETERPLRGLKRYKVASKVSLVILEDDSYFYDLLYGSSISDYDKYISAFEHAKTTLKTH